MFRSARVFNVSVAMMGLALTVPGCTDIAYYPGYESLVVDSDTPATEHPLFTYWVQTEYDLDYAPPVTDAEIESLGEADAEPSERDPWIEAGDVDMEIAWSLTNDSDDDIRAWVMLDGASEFYDWNPISMFGATGDDEEIPFPTLLGFTPLDLAAGETLRGEFREDDLREAAYDLDVMTRFCGGPLAVLYNRHEVDPTGTEYVPDDATIAGLYRIRLTLGTDGPAHLEYGIRVRDRAQVLFDANSPDYDARFEAEPEIYVPAALAPTGMAMGDPATMSDYCLAVNPPDEMP